MDRIQPNYTTIDHTADLGIEVRAPEAAALFASAALAMFDLVTELDRVELQERRRIEVAGIDREDLLVRWLGELLSMHDAEGWLLGAVEIHDLTERSLNAEVAGERLDPSRHRLKGELKAVTHHHTRVSRDEKGWTARVVFDV